MARRRIAALAALAALSFTACANQDADEGDVRDAMTDAGLPSDQAGCIARRFVDEFNQDQLNDLAAADDPADFPQGTEDEVDAILRRCTQGEDGSDEATTTTESGGSGSDEGSTSTTAAEGGSTTTAGG